MPEKNSVIIESDFDAHFPLTEIAVVFQSHCISDKAVTAPVEPSIERIVGRYDDRSTGGMKNRAARLGSIAALQPLTGGRYETGKSIATIILII